MTSKRKPAVDEPYQEPQGGSYFRETEGAPAQLVERTEERQPDAPAADAPIPDEGA